MKVWVLVHPTRGTGAVFKTLREASAELLRLAELEWRGVGRFKSGWRVLRRTVRRKR